MTYNEGDQILENGLDFFCSTLHQICILDDSSYLLQMTNL